MGTQFSKENIPTTKRTDNNDRKLLSVPWRKPPPFTMENLKRLKEKIQNFGLPSEIKHLRARIILVGNGSETSSICNTLISAFNDMITIVDNSRSNSNSIKTTEYNIRIYSRERYLNIVLDDTRDINYSDPHAIDHVLKTIERFYYEICCVVFVIDADRVHIMGETNWETFDTLRARLDEKGIHMCVFLTNLDRMSYTLSYDVSKVFECPEVKKAVDKVTTQLGVPEHDVLLMKTYENEIDIDVTISILALTALDHALGSLGDFLFRQPESLDKNEKHKNDPPLHSLTAADGNEPDNVETVDILLAVLSDEVSVENIRQKASRLLKGGTLSFNIEEKDFSLSNPPSFLGGQVKTSITFLDAENRLVIKCGKTTGLKKGHLAVTDTMIKISEPQLLHLPQGMTWNGKSSVVMKGQYLVQNKGSPFFDLGDSGAGVYLVEEDGNSLSLVGIAIGLLNDHTVVTPIGPVLESLGLQPSNLQFPEPMETEIL